MASSPMRPDGKFDVEALAKAARFPGLEGLDLAKDVTLPPALQMARDALGMGQGLWRGRARAGAPW